MNLIAEDSAAHTERVMRRVPLATLIGLHGGGCGRCGGGAISVMERQEPYTAWWHCGACQCEGDHIDYLQHRYLGITAPGAVRLLAAIADALDQTVRP